VSRQIAYAVVADGGTDRTLIPIIEWAIHRLDPEVEILEPEFRKRKGPVKDFLETYKTGAMIVFVHRDAENVSLTARLAEFSDVTREDIVPMVPIRMTEAWLLIDGSAIAKAADRPSAVVSVPAVNQLESLADPKKELEDRLMQVAGHLTGRRRKRFRASIVNDFSPLEQLTGFQRFQSDLAARYPYNVSPS
jgi:hypothetical protein